MRGGFVAKQTKRGWSDKAEGYDFGTTSGAIVVLPLHLFGRARTDESGHWQEVILLR